jgi:hypothetical protein
LRDWIAFSVSRRGCHSAEESTVNIKSGIYWITWANLHAPDYTSINDLVEPFRTHADTFVKALRAAGAKVEVSVTKRPEKRAYLFHWCWLIGLGKKKASDALPKVGVPIDWNHGDDVTSQKAAKEMITGFKLAVPPRSKNAPALASNHIVGKAIDMTITWKGTIAIQKPDGSTESVPYLQHVNDNTKLHAVGALYGVKKLVTDAPHWSYNGH